MRQYETILIVAAHQSFPIDPTSDGSAPAAVVPGRCAVSGTLTSWVGAKVKQTLE
jgi:hypothetical protein